MLREILIPLADSGHGHTRRTCSRRCAAGGIVLLAAIGLGGCKTAPPPRAAPEPVPVVDRGIVVLASDASPAFSSVARELSLRHSRQGVELFTLAGEETRNAALLRRIQSSDRTRVVAIGLPAARLARRLEGKQVVFCQVFNHEGANLVTPWMKGVAAVPPPGEQLRAWKAIQPALARVAMLTGPNLKGLVSEARTASREQGIELRVVEVKTDKELLYAFKRIGPTVQGLWLVPDNRVLSRHVLRDVVGYALKEGKSVLAFNRELLSLGAMLSAENDAGDIAETVLQRLDPDAPGREPSGADVWPLRRADIHINALVVSQLGLSLPPSFRDKVHVH